MKFHLPPDKKIYFASDFHLGAPTPEISREREMKILRWLDEVKKDAEHIFLMGDLFDFWFEFTKVIPKGFVRFQGKLAEIVDSGIPITIFTGNHDMWMFGYFEEEIGVKVYRKPQVLEVNNKKLYLAHGDGLGPNDQIYKILKVIFENSFFQWLFRFVHPYIGVSLAQWWSLSKKKKLYAKGEKKSYTHREKEKEWLWQYAYAVEKKKHHDFYIFGHRHLPLDLEVADNSRYVNLGEWIRFDTYAVFNGESVDLLKFEG